MIVTGDRAAHINTMYNATGNASLYEYYDDSETDDPDLPSSIENYIWVTGIILSSLCLILQVTLFIIRPKTRKIDQKILTQLTVARLMNTLLEFLITNEKFNSYTKDLMFVLYTQTDAVLICWMFVFTRNLYEKIVLVFVLQKWNFIVLCLLIWILTIPIGVLSTVFLSLFLEYYSIYYKVHAWIKFIVLTLNVLFFGRIFYVIITRSKKSKRNFSEIIKTCVISFILVCITSLQVLVNDIFSYLEVCKTVTDAFYIINSYQVIAVTIIFLILVRNNGRSASTKTCRSETIS